MNPDNEINPVIVFEGNDREASMVKSLLANAEIETFTGNERMGSLAPWDVSGGGAGSVKVVVSNVDLIKAKEVVAEFENAASRS